MRERSCIYHDRDDSDKWQPFHTFIIITKLNAVNDYNLLNIQKLGRILSSQLAVKFSHFNLYLLSHG